MGNAEIVILTQSTVLHYIVEAYFVMWKRSL